MGVFVLVLVCVNEARGADVFPRVQAVPLPKQECAFEIDGLEVTRYHYGVEAPKPYLFPVRGPAGRRLTGMAHPYDPIGHRHHRSIWVGHRDVNGVNFWEETEDARRRADDARWRADDARWRAEIVTDGIEGFAQGSRAASATFRHRWLGAEGQALLEEQRTIIVHALAGDERYLDITLALTAADRTVTLGKTPFGFLGIRVSPMMAVKDGQGEIRNAEGERNETGVHWKRSRWVDYTGTVSPEERNGIALFDHPGNPRFPTYFHVRDDGWMGASFCYEAPYELAQGERLVLRYRLYIHGSRATSAIIDQHWESFAGAQE